MKSEGEMLIDETQLEEFVLDSGLVSKKDVEVAEKMAQKNHTTLGQELITKGLLSEDDLRRVQAYMLGIPFISLKNQKIDFDTLVLIPEPIARKHNIIAFKKHNDSLEVAMLDTADLAAIEFVKKKVGLKILPRLTDEESIKNTLLQYQKTLKAEFGDIIKRESESLGDISAVSDENGEEVSEEDLKKIAEDLPVVRVVNALLKHAIIQNASDIHVEPMGEMVLVRYRIDGMLHDAMTLPKNAGPSITARIKVLSSLKLDEKRLPQDGRFKMEVDGQRVSFRVSVLPTHFGEKIVMRLLRDDAGGFTLEGLGFYGDSLEKIHEALKKTTGMILTTGPTGSGKTTTLYTILDILNTPQVNISTGLRALVRQDPDIIMVGEIRDQETASLAVNAALTGHLVLSTLHTNSAAGAVPRMIDMGIEPFLLVSTINVIIAQRLVRKLDQKGDQYTLTKKEIESLSKAMDLKRVLDVLKEEKIVSPGTTFEKIPFYRPVKSKESEDGYRGRLGIYEVMQITPTIKNMVMAQKTTDEIAIQARAEGMLTMAEDGLVKAAQGITTIEEVLRVVKE